MIDTGQGSDGTFHAGVLFQTFDFGLFLVVVFIGSRLLAGRRPLQHVFLLLASYWFYMAWHAAYLILIVFSTLLDYVVGAAIHRSQDPRRRRLLLICSLVGNLGLLGVFKYYNWFAHDLANGLTVLGLHLSLPLLEVLLPVGISFYTFQTLSYTLDIYYRRLEPRESLIDFALFVAFFPQLVAGPIVRAAEFLPQLDTHRPATDDEQRSGLYLLLKGLVKKAVIADMLATFLVDPVFADPGHFGTLAVLVAAYAFKFQIYCDFSGYSEMAIGIGRLLGFRLPVNFRSPYKATSVTNYWQRWHITLGSWFRDYLYFPLGGSRRGLRRTCFNLLATMLLVGLWHGASWTFVLWGGFYGVLMATERLARSRRGRPAEVVGWRRVLRVTWVFQLTTIGSLVFRSVDFHHLAEMGRAFAAPAQLTIPEANKAAWLMLAVAAITHFVPDRLKERCEEWFCALPPFLQATATTAVLVAVTLAGTETRPFYYFQF